MTLGTTYTRISPEDQAKKKAGKSYHKTVFTIENEDDRKYHEDLQECGFSYTPSGYPQSCSDNVVTDPFGDTPIGKPKVSVVGSVCVSCES